MAEIRANNVPEDLYLRFDIERAKRGRMSVKDAVIEAIELWIAGSGQTTAGRLTPPQHEHEHELLEALLSDPDTAESVKVVLETFARALSSGRGAKKRKAG